MTKFTIMFDPADKKAPVVPVDPNAELEASSAEKTREYIEEEKAYRRGAVSIRDLIAPASFKITPNFLNLGELFVRTIFVINYPRYISIGWFSPVINLNSTFDVSMFFYPVSSAIIINQL